MRRFSAGFTLIELMVVIGIIGLLAAVLLPLVTDTQRMTNAAADAMQLRTHSQWLEIYKSKHSQFLPMQGGCRFVLSTWTAKIFDHTEENLDKYFTPGSQDPVWREARERMQKGDDPWRDIKTVSSADTHYVGRAKEKLASANHGSQEAWMANDNEGQWSLPDGTVNILFAGGSVRTYSYQDLERLFGVGPFDKANPVVTYGPGSPIAACQSLAN